MKTAQAEDQSTGDHQKKTKEDECTAKIGHRSSGSGQKRGGFAKKLGRLARFGEDADTAREFAGLLAHALQVGVEAGQNQNPAAWKLARHVVDKGKSVALGHGDVAKQKIGGEDSSTEKSLLRRVDSFGFKAVLVEDKRKRVGYQMVIVNDQDSLHEALPRNSR
jgi:hypothetical protein